MTVKQSLIRVVAAILLLAIITAPLAAAQSTEDEEYRKMQEYLQASEDNESKDSQDLKITPTLAEGQAQFNKFSFSDDSYDLLALLNFLFYFLSIGGTIWIGILTVIDLLKGKNDAKSIYNDLKSRKSVQGIIITVLSVKIVYVVIDFLFNMEL